jgi:hypothetical protein
MVEGLILHHLLSGVDGDVIAVRSLRNIILCKITVRPTARGRPPRLVGSSLRPVPARYCAGDL